MITQEELKKLVKYNPKTGIFTRLVDVANRKAGDPVGSVDYHGYVQTSIHGHMYKVHRLVFLYMTGEIPDQVDHINHIRTDNRWENLRSADGFINQKNKGVQCNNTSGTLGVWWHKQRSKWAAEIKVKGKKIHLGIFKSKDDAIKARKLAEERYGFHPNHGMNIV